MYNAEKWIGEAIDSILVQTYSDWELIVTDDGSEDSSVDIVKKYLSDDRVKLIVDGEHRGISFRLNQQVALAKGDCFARMDADDIMLPNRLSMQVAFMTSHPDVDVCGTGAGEWTFIHPSVMGKREWFLKHPYRTECDGCEDWDLWLRTKKISNFASIPEPLIVYRQSEVFDKEKYLLRRKQGRKTIRLNKSLLSPIHYCYLLADSYAKSAFTYCFR